MPYIVTIVAGLYSVTERRIAVVASDPTKARRIAREWFRREHPRTPIDNIRSVVVSDPVMGELR